MENLQPALAGSASDPLLAALRAGDARDAVQDAQAADIPEDLVKAALALRQED